MNSTERLELLLLIPLIGVNLPFLLALIVHRKSAMTFSPAAQAIIDTLTTANADLAEALANASNGGGAQAAEDLAGIKAAVDPLAAAIAAAASKPTALTVSPTSLSVVVGQPVAASLTVTGGTSPYTFSTSEAGLSVDSSGNVSGTVTTGGDSTITVTDAAGATVSVSVTAS